MTKTYNVKNLMEMIKNESNIRHEYDRKLFFAGRYNKDCRSINEKYKPMLHMAFDELEAESEKFYEFFDQYYDGEIDLLPSAEEVAKTLIEIDEKIALCSSQEAAIGTTVKFDPIADNRYWSQLPRIQSLQFKAELTHAGWVITSAYIADCMPEWERYLITFTPKTLAEMAREMSRPVYDNYYDDEEEE